MLYFSTILMLIGNPYFISLFLLFHLHTRPLSASNMFHISFESKIVIFSPFTVSL